MSAVFQRSTRATRLTFSSQGRDNSIVAPGSPVDGRPSMAYNHVHASHRRNHDYHRSDRCLGNLFIQGTFVPSAFLNAAILTMKQWGYFVFGMFAFFWVAWTVTWTARKHAAALGSDISKVYLICGVWTIFLWFLYPIAWGLSEGGNIIAPDSEAVFYGILDVMAKPVFGALLLWGHRNIDPARLGIHIRDYDDEFQAPGVGEKHSNNGTSGVTAAPAV